MAITLKRQITPEEKVLVLARHGRKCFATGHAISDSDSLQFDHIRAHALGGQSELDNIAPMCEHHNKAKGTLALGEFRTKLRLEEFFSTGERLTLKHLLQYLRKDDEVSAYGESVAASIKGEAISLENHSHKSNHQLYECEQTGWKYFYGTLPVSVINSDDDEDLNLGLQPRFLIPEKVFELFRHFQNHPVLQPSVGRISGDRIVLFDGQHKVAALLWNGRRKFECKIYLNPDLRILNQTNIAAHDKFAQTRFFSSVMILKLGAQFGSDFEAYRKIEDGVMKTEKNFMGYLEGVRDMEMSKGERNKRFRSYLLNSVLEDSSNKAKALISVGNRSSNTQPLTVDMLSKSLFACFLCTDPVMDDMTTSAYKRELEFKNNIALINTLYDLALASWNPKAPNGDTNQLKLDRLFSSKSMMAWSELLRDAICAKLDLEDTDERERPFYRELSDEDFQKIRKVVERLLAWQMWIAPSGGDIDSYLAGNKSTLKEWFKSKGLTTGYLMGAGG